MGIIEKRGRFFCAGVIVILALVTGFPSTVGAQQEQLHPRNKILVDLGLMPYPKYYPSVPRFTASQALYLYQSGKGKVVWCGADGRKVVGAYHLLGRDVYNIPAKVRIAKGQMLLLYCD